MRRSKEMRTLDNLSASRMFLERHEALSALSDSITIRFKLKRMGIDLSDPRAENITSLIDSLGFQKMLNDQPITTRFSAVKREIKTKKIWR